MTSYFSLSESQKPIVHELLNNTARNRCKESFQFFCRYVTGEFWKPYKHLEYLCDILQQVQEKKIRRLILNMPPLAWKEFHHL